MEELYTGEVTVQEALVDAAAHLDSAGVTELTCAIALPLLAFLLGRILNRLIDNSPRKSLHTSFLDFMGPLFAPCFAVLFLMAAGFTMRYLDIKLHVLPFVWKLAVAWLAIRLVVMVSSRQSAGWLIVLVIAPITLMHLFGLWDPITESLSDITFTLGDNKLTAYGVLKSVAALIALFWITGFIVKATDTRLRRIRRIHVSNRVLIMKFLQIIIYSIVFLIGLQVMGVDLTALSVLGGALGVGIGFGLQKIASNFISGIILLFEKSVSVDDLIMLEDGTTGFIRQNAARYTLVEVADGREIMIPNEEFITQRVTTLTHSNKRGRIDIPVGVGYESDLKQVLKLLVQAASSCKDCLKDPAPHAWVIGFGDSAINAQLSFWVENISDGKNGPRSEILIEIVRLFRENDIDIPYPHQVAVANPDVERRFQHLEQHLQKKQTSPEQNSEKVKKAPVAAAKKKE